MSNNNYTLEIISHHEKFNNKSLRKYQVEGIETIGVWGNEPFEIRFKNNTWQKVQVKLTLDGTDILTGKPADTEVSKEMWVVNGHETLSLKAWPETSGGGAAFVFTNANNSVAVHTHGNLSSRGIIAAAVFVEGHVPDPIRLTPPTEHHHHHYYRWPYYPSYPSYPAYPITTTHNWIGDSIGIRDSMSYNSSSSSINSKSLESLVAIGAGQYVDQKITYVQGLIKPVLTETIRIKYVWYDDLVQMLRAQNASCPQPSGFPGDKEHGISLKNTPRIGEKKANFQRTSEETQSVFSRF